jgi:hypothetical protein
VSVSKKVIKTTRGDRIADVADVRGWDPDRFYERHRGGWGPVIVVFAACPRRKRQPNRVAVFGSIETAQEWAFSLGADWHCVFSPYVVDEPDFGNATQQ